MVRVCVGGGNLGMQRHEIEALFDACLLTDEEMKQFDDFMHDQPNAVLVTVSLSFFFLVLVLVTVSLSFSCACACALSSPPRSPRTRFSRISFLSLSLELANTLARMFVGNCSCGIEIEAVAYQPL